MQRPVHAREEFEYARAAVDSLCRAESLVEATSHWKEVLRRLERLWHKADAHFSRSPKWNGWKGRFEKLRSNDPLLLYLRFARGAEEHAIVPIVEEQLERIGFEGKSGEPFITCVSLEDNVLAFGVGPAVKVTVEPAHLRPEPVFYRSRRAHP